MNRKMLDTNICIYLIKSRPQSVREKFKQHEIGDLALSSISVSELMYGAYKSLHVKQNLKALELFLTPLDIVEYDYNAAVEYGKIRAILEKQGNVTGGLDMQIAAHARSLNMTLVSNNLKEFQRVEDLSLENWI